MVEILLIFAGMLIGIIILTKETKLSIKNNFKIINIGLAGIIFAVFSNVILNSAWGMQSVIDFLTLKKYWGFGPRLILKLSYIVTSWGLFAFILLGFKKLKKTAGRWKQD